MHARHLGLEEREEPGDGDVVFDFSRMERPDLGGVVLVLTAQRLAARDDREVWARRMPPRLSDLLASLGLADLFPVAPADGHPHD